MLFSRFARRFFVGFWSTMRESRFDKLVAGCTVAYLVVHGVIRERWEFVTPIVWAVCLIVVVHAFGAAHAVSKEISKEIEQSPVERETPIFSPTGKKATVISESPAHGNYRLKLYGFAVLITLPCLCMAIWVGEPYPGTGQDERAYLKATYEGVSYDRLGDIRAKVVFVNVGKLQASPKSLFYSAAVISKPLSPIELDRFFSTAFFENQATAISYNPNTFDIGDQWEQNPVASVGFEPEEYRQNREAIDTGQKLIYVFGTTSYQDRLGKMVVDSCVIFRGPDFTRVAVCDGHNGPRDLSKATRLIHPLVRLVLYIQDFVVRHL
jgi:hypothetical protein